MCIIMHVFKIIGMEGVCRFLLYWQRGGGNFGPILADIIKERHLSLMLQGIYQKWAASKKGHIFPIGMSLFKIQVPPNKSFLKEIRKTAVVDQARHGWSVGRMMSPSVISRMFTLLIGSSGGKLSRIAYCCLPLFQGIRNGIHLTSTVAV